MHETFIINKMQCRTSIQITREKANVWCITDTKFFDSVLYTHETQVLRSEVLHSAPQCYSIAPSGRQYVVD